MKRRTLRLLALMLTAALLAGCSLRGAVKRPVFPSEPQASATEAPREPEPTGDEPPAPEPIPETPPAPGALDQVVYRRPEPEAVIAAIEAAESRLPGASAEEAAQDLDAVLTTLDDYDTRATLAMIRYYQNMEDTYYQEEYEFCMAGYPGIQTVFDRYCDALADSPLRQTLESDLYFGPGFFDGYGADSVDWSLAEELFARETALQAEYDRVMASAETDFWGNYRDEAVEEIARIYADLIRVRNEIAEIYDYDSYESFACENLYTRDYGQEETTRYLQDIRRYMVPLFVRMEEEWYTWNIDWTGCPEDEMVRYAASTAGAMGGEVLEAWDFMQSNGLGDFVYSENKYDGSFEIFLYSYGWPFMFVNPTGELGDQLTAVHEFGHFVQDYVWEGQSGANVDVAEIFSQAMEFLSLDYAEISRQEQTNLLRYQLASCVNVYIQQALFYEFEQRAYALPEDRLNAEGLCDLFAQVADEYKLIELYGTPETFWTQVPHFFSSPFYVISYCTSLSGAVQVYEAQVDRGNGLEIYRDLLYASDQPLQTLLTGCGLRSPFEEGAVEAAANFLEKEMFG